MKAACTTVALGLLVCVMGAQAGTLQLLGMGVGSFSVPITSLQEARFATTKR
jgi:phosphoenolpyruvate-protein kinase (PTS system EI component)